MTVSGLKKVTVSQVCMEIRGFPAQVLMNLQNGVGAFILQCHKLSFHYCDWAGSSRGMKYACTPPIYPDHLLTFSAPSFAILSKSSRLQTLRSKLKSLLAHEDTQS
jgi:hypothetical protein